MKGEADFFAEVFEIRLNLWSGTGENGSDFAASTEESTGLPGVDGLEKGHVARNAFALDIEHFSADESVRARGLGENADGLAGADGIDGGLGEDFECEGEQSITRQDSKGFPEDFVASGAAPAEVVVVDRGEIVVDQAETMDEFDGTTGVEGKVWSRSASLGGGDGEDGAEALPRGEGGVPHGAVEVGRVICFGGKEFADAIVNLLAK